MRLLVTGSLGMWNLGQRRLRRPRLYTTQLNNVLQRAAITFVSYKKNNKRKPQEREKKKIVERNGLRRELGSGAG